MSFQKIIFLRLRKQHGRKRRNRRFYHPPRKSVFPTFSHTAKVLRKFLQKTNVFVLGLIQVLVTRIVFVNHFEQAHMMIENSRLCLKLIVQIIFFRRNNLNICTRIYCFGRERNVLIIKYERNFGIVQLRENKFVESRFVLVAERCAENTVAVGYKRIG